MGVPCRVFPLRGVGAATSEVGLAGVQATRTWLVGQAGQGDSAAAAAGRREPGNLHLHRVQLTHPGQLLLAVGAGGHRGIWGRRHSGKGQWQWPWQKPEWRELQHEPFRWEREKDRCKISSVRWFEGEPRQEEQPPLLRLLMANSTRGVWLGRKTLLRS